jgi:methyltransferase (TIGR00027 family)
MTSEPLIRDVTDTARWVAAYRAEETARPDALFCDRLAERLAGDRGRAIIAQVRQPAVRFGVVLRTAVLDREIVRSISRGGIDTVLNLAAGLDTRPYRLELPVDLRWIEVDLPAIIDYKEPLLADETPRCRLERVRLDLADTTARRKLFERIGGSSKNTLVITEGLLSYLDAGHVAALAQDLASQPSFSEWLTDITGANVVDDVRDSARHLKAEGEASVRFTPAEGTAFFEPHGWREADFLGLFIEAPKLGRDSLLGKTIRLLMRFAPAEKRAAMERSIGIVRLRPISASR